MNDWKAKIAAIFAEQGDILEVPVDATTDNQVSFKKGYTRNYSKDAKDEMGTPLVKYGIERTKFNYLLKLITSSIKEIQETLPIYIDENQKQQLDVGAIITATRTFDVLESLLCVDDKGEATRITKENLIKSLHPDIDLSDENITVTETADKALDNFLAIDEDRVKKANKLLGDNIEVIKELAHGDITHVLTTNADNTVQKSTTIPQKAIEQIDLSLDNVTVQPHTTNEKKVKPMIVDETGKVKHAASLPSELIVGDIFAKGFKTIVMNKDTHPNGIDDLRETGLYALASMDDYKDIINNSLPKDRKEYITKVLKQIMKLLEVSDEELKTIDIANFSDLIYCPSYQIQVVGVSQGETDNRIIRQTFILFHSVIGTRKGTLTLDTIVFEDIKRETMFSYIPHADIAEMSGVFTLNDKKELVYNTNSKIKAAEYLFLKTIEDDADTVNSYNDITESGYYKVNKGLTEAPANEDERSILYVFNVESMNGVDKNIVFQVQYLIPNNVNPMTKIISKYLTSPTWKMRMGTRPTDKDNYTFTDWEDRKILLSELTTVGSKEAVNTAVNTLLVKDSNNVITEINKDKFIPNTALNKHVFIVDKNSPIKSVKDLPIGYHELYKKLADEPEGLRTDTISPLIHHYKRLSPENKDIDVFLAYQSVYHTLDTAIPSHMGQINENKLVWTPIRMVDLSTQATVNTEGAMKDVTHIVAMKERGTDLVKIPLEQFNAPTIIDEDNPIDNVINLPYGLSVLIKELKKEPTGVRIKEEENTNPYRYVAIKKEARRNAQGYRVDHYTAYRSNKMNESMSIYAIGQVFTDTSPDTLGWVTYTDREKQALLDLSCFTEASVKGTNETTAKILGVNTDSIITSIDKADFTPDLSINCLDIKYTIIGSADTVTDVKDLPNGYFILEKELTNEPKGLRDDTLQTVPLIHNKNKTFFAYMYGLSLKTNIINPYFKGQIMAGFDAPDTIQWDSVRVMDITKGVMATQTGTYADNDAVLMYNSSTFAITTVPKTELTGNVGLKKETKEITDLVGSRKITIPDKKILFATFEATDNTTISVTTSVVYEKIASSGTPEQFAVFVTKNNPSIKWTVQCTKAGLNQTDPIKLTLSEESFQCLRNDGGVPQTLVFNIRPSQDTSLTADDNTIQGVMVTADNKHSLSVKFKIKPEDIDKIKKATSEESTKDIRVQAQDIQLLGNCLSKSGTSMSTGVDVEFNAFFGFKTPYQAGVQNSAKTASTVLISSVPAETKINGILTYYYE